MIIGLLPVAEAAPGSGGMPAGLTEAALKKCASLSLSLSLSPAVAAASCQLAKWLDLPCLEWTDVDWRLVHWLD